ncbi:16S rRNA (cytosine(967)-C(5))-methyltransferase RsmB [Steroidobacter sp. S1-65]|uniref:16S rRNA (cytosine(967)-C(5))-methyltransferase n=1 Tax=Steroidobacter gossypii TaxID=2805490 RepID=A0ABS1WTW4_9GAMM|nr:16S rRNA (cytosine(967)-C(5))-methyltransferase RsmB [Steroidobacter gossypii]MBM0104419.1 16S rRNA (cytosine(967)-C(5))-methyltransferase RsmB [Steroidobacter gossypii]
MSASAAVRAKAARIVADVAEHGRSLDAVLSHESSATKQERGLLRSLSYDSIRWYVRLDALLSRLLSRPNQTLDPEIRALAIVGLCQLIYTDIPEHAAVAETVAATRLLKQPRASGFVNAVLRRCQREHARLLPEIDRDLAVRTAHPRWLVEKLRKDWGERANDILDANNQRPPFWIRVNRLRVTPANYREQLQASQIGVAASMFEDTALLLDRAMDVGELPGFNEGLVSVQDAAAQLAGHMLDPQRGERILDACAAPGGKTGHLLELQPEPGVLTAVDVSPERLTRVTQNLQRLQMSAQVLAGDAAAPAGWWDGKTFNRILLDVPCSATGVIRRHPDIKLLRRGDDIAALAARQSQLLRTSWSLLQPGGRLLYASCSALQTETTAVIEDFLRTEPSARDVTEQRLQDLPASEALGQAHVGTASGVHGLRIAAGSAGMDGFYYALLEKPC